MAHEPTTANTGVLPIALNLAGACFLSGLIIAGVYFFTADTAAQKKIELQQAAMRQLVPTATQFIPVKGKTGWNMAMQGTKTIAYLVPTESKGYGGAIKILAAITPEGRVYNFNILESKETPGLGDKASQPEFQKQFRGKTIAGLQVVKDPANHQAIQAISGATITSKAVTAAVKAAVTAVVQESRIGGKQDARHLGDL